MPNVVPYLILIVLSICALTIVFLRSKQFVTLVWFLAFAGLIYIFEFIILVLFQSYTYYPKLIDNAYWDSMFGAFVSNFCAVPVAGITVVTFRLRFRWFILLSLFFTGVEWFFITIDIYKHNWWRLPYTTVFLICFFWLSRVWANQTARGSRLIRYFSLLLFSLSLCDSLAFGMALAGISQYHIGWFANPTRDDILVRFIFILTTSIILSTTIYRTNAIRWIIIAIAATLALQIILLATGIMRIYISLWLFYPIFIACHCLIAWLLVKSNHALLQQKRHA
ncbi:hypothetical protein PCCS19_49230 [Paenibacillus sp. CCS19]|uniref:hypothetical protein n=1 Tax=Paenibacillus sp. CCS19 TaxID=3158387 RepID=UPI0025606C44|nr:hypothetical protein [Paenibacillus cellulosilyticus]GMK41864.1 hypothetical protein PCCS19_49230 [Paenibacillus cellulosilyticus]